MSKTSPFTVRAGVLLAALTCCCAAWPAGLLAAPSTAASSKEETGDAPRHRTRYRISVALDFDRKSYTGTARVRWVNRSSRPTSILYFHLYANKRSDGGGGGPSAASETPAEINADSAVGSIEEPRLEVTEVRRADTGQPLAFALDDGEATLRINLPEPVGAEAWTEVDLKWRGRVPELNVERTKLLAHVMQQVNAVLRSEREMRHARDLNFRCRDVMLLASAYPVLAVRDGDDWRRRVETTIGDTAFTEAADYEVSIEAPADIKLFTSAEEQAPEKRSSGERVTRRFAGKNLRDFAIVAGRGLRVEERSVENLKVRSVFSAGHEAVGRRVLAAAVHAARIYTMRFGRLPQQTVSVVEAPLAAGVGCAEFAGLGVIASAFYVDFDSPEMRHVPEIVHEQRASIEDSLEYTVAHVVAHEWWGGAVGSDPERAPVLDEALANWSALLYYEEVYGAKRAAVALDDQLRGVYKIYRTFGGEDMEANRTAREYRNFFQYSAIIFSKGALMFVALRQLLGAERFFTALKSYYQGNLLEIAELDDLRGAFVAESPLPQRRQVTRTFNRWLTEKRGDQDIAPPDPQLAATLGVAMDPNAARSGDRHNAFARLGKFFWRQMTRLR